jgi:hypothetical protein
LATADEAQVMEHNQNNDWAVQARHVRHSAFCWMAQGILIQKHKVLQIQPFLSFELHISELGLHRRAGGS